MAQRILLAIAFTAMIPFSAFADHTKSFFVAPIVTDLQRVTVSSSAATYAVVNCSSLLLASDVDMSDLDERSFVGALKNASPNMQHLLLVCRYQLAQQGDAELRMRVKDRLLAICEKAGFLKISHTEVFTSQQWQKAYGPAASFTEPPEAQELLVEDELIRAFPVRTRLSKFVLGDIDCIVEVVQPIDGRTTEISAQLKSSIRRAMHAIQLTRRQTLMFKLSTTEAGRDTVDELFNASQTPTVPQTEDPALLEIFRSHAAAYKPSLALMLANELGFKKIVYSNSPGGGAPEKLIGNSAPNFNLPRVNGDLLDLHDFIRDRPALITFWGLACGPCRKEAPYLSRLDEKYSQTFSIVAVNGYNDDIAAVAEYVAAVKLTHPVLLQGRSVADDLYFVGAYPTTFWVDHRGKVIGYEIGFRSVESLERRIQELLDAADD